MKRNKRVESRTEQKRKRKALTLSLITVGVILASIVTWVGWNDWDLRKSVASLNAAIGVGSVPNTHDDRHTDVKDGAQEVGGMDEEAPESTEVEKEPPVVKDSGGYIKGVELPDEPTYINGILIANKEYPLPETYAPGEVPEAREAFNRMAAEAVLSEFNLTAFSTYRSFDYQKELYERYVNRDGKEEADRYSARPGYSEHQTGLAFDIGEVNYEQFWASSEFGNTEAGKWLASNAHRFGFILRYPQGKEEITGYMHESWHFRYVGTEIATEIYEQNITLEEYVGVQ